MTNEEAQGMYNAGVAAAVEDRFAALRGTVEPEDFDSEPEPTDLTQGQPVDRFAYLNAPAQRLVEEAWTNPPALQTPIEDAAVIEAAKAISKSRDGKTYCINVPQTIDGALYYALDRALVARRVARGEPR
jgi:hypothetical protein